MTDHRVPGNLTQSSQWQQLTTHAERMRETHLRDLFAADPQRAQRLVVDAAGIHLDYSKHRVTDETLAVRTSARTRTRTALAGNVSW